MEVQSSYTNKKNVMNIVSMHPAQVALIYLLEILEIEVKFGHLVLLHYQT